MNKNFVFLGIVAILAIYGISQYYNAYSYGNITEKELSATIKNNENILSTYSLKVVEVTQVPAMMKDNLKEVVTESLRTKYGKSGSQATFQRLKDQKIQTVMEAGHKITDIENQTKGYPETLKEYLEQDLSLRLRILNIPPFEGEMDLLVDVLNAALTA